MNDWLPQIRKKETRNGTWATVSHNGTAPYATCVLSGLGDREGPPWEVITDANFDMCVFSRWRPNHETFLYPFLPAHVSRPKELKKLYFIHLPPSKVLSVPKNMKLLAVPLFELYDNTARYGPQLSAIPHYLSRYRFEFVDEDGNVSSVMPGAGEMPNPQQTVKVLVGQREEEGATTEVKGEASADVDVKIENGD